MAYYLLQVSYTPETWKALIKNPQDRTKAVRPVAEKLGGSLQGAWFAFGDYDLVLILEMPDNISAGALAVAAAAGGAVRSIKTTPLLTITEGLAVMKKAASSGYRPPK
jgi:uncharacterized protein with GYD domain